MQGHGTTGGSDHQLALVNLDEARFGKSTNDNIATIESNIVLIDGSRLALSICNCS